MTGTKEAEYIERIIKLEASRKKLKAQLEKERAVIEYLLKL